MENDLISVIIPVYNVEHYLGDCVESALNQSYKNLEILLIDDGSTDNSGKICDEYSKKDNRIKVFHKKNGGAASAKNFGVKKAVGKFICFIDSDDIVEKDYVEYLYSLISKENADLSIGCYTVKSNNKEYNIGKNQIDSILSSKDCLKKLLLDDGITVSLCAKLYKKNILKSIYFPENFMYEDDATMYSIIMKCKTISYGNKSIYTYYIRNNSVMTKDFTDKRLVILKYANNMKKEILFMYPDLKSFVDRKFIMYNFSILRQLVVSSLNEEQLQIKKNIVHFLKSNSSLILKSKYYSLKEKIAVSSLLFGEKFYRFCWNIYKKIKY